MTATLSPIVRRLLALLLLAALLAAAAMALAPVVKYSRQLDAEHTRLVDWLQRYQAVRAGSAAVDSRMTELEHVRESQRSAYLVGDTPALAAVSLQERAKQVVVNAGSELTSTQILPEEAAEDLTKIGIQLEIKAQMEALRSILYELETGTPRLFVDQVDISQQVNFVLEEFQVETSSLAIRLQVSGYRANGDPLRPANIEAAQR